MLTSEAEVDDDAKAQAGEDREKLTALQQERDARHGRLTDETLVGLFRAAMTVRAAANHGGKK